MSTTSNPAPRKRRRPLRWIILAAVILFAFIGCAALVSSPGQEPVAPPAATTEDAAEPTVAAPAEEKAEADELVLTVTSNGPATVSYGPMGSFSTESFEGQWSKTVDYEWGDGYTLSVTSDFTGGPVTAESEFTCQITKDGKVQDEQTASGEYASVTCSVM